MIAIRHCTAAGKNQTRHRSLKKKTRPAHRQDGELRSDKSHVVFLFNCLTFGIERRASKETGCGTTKIFGG